MPSHSGTLTSQKLGLCRALSEINKELWKNSDRHVPVADYYINGKAKTLEESAGHVQLVTNCYDANKKNVLTVKGSSSELSQHARKCDKPTCA